MLFRMCTLTALLIGLLLPDVASAQRRRASNGQGWEGSWGNRAWNGGRGYWNNGFYGGYRNFGGVYWGYNAYPYGYSYSYGNSYPSGLYGLSGPIWYPGTRYGAAYFDPSVVDSNRYQDSSLSLNANRVRVEVILPDPDAEMIIQGQRMDLRGRNRIFISPDLDQGKVYTYTITMRRSSSGRNDDETRKVEVRPGTSVTVDFSRPERQQVAPQPVSGQEDRSLPLPK